MINNSKINTSFNPPQNLKKAPLTVISYMCGDNNLMADVTKDLAELEEIGSTNDLNILAQIDRGSYAGEHGKLQNGVVRYLIKKDNDPNVFNSDVLSKLGLINSSDPEVLRQFIEYVMINFPSENYLIFFNDHGRGFIGAMEDKTSESFMTLDNIKMAVKKAEENAGVPKEKVMIAFDACLMAQAEAAYQFKDVASVYIASQELLGQEGLPYKEILMDKDPVTGDYKHINYNISQKELAGRICEKSALSTDNVFTISAVDLKKMDEFALKLDGLAKVLLESPEDYETIKKLIENTQGFSRKTYSSNKKPYNQMKDLSDFLNILSNSDELKNNVIKEEANSLLNVIKEAVIINKNTDKDCERAHGLSLYLPETSETTDKIIKIYDKLDLSKNTKWDEFIAKFTGLPSIEIMQEGKDLKKKDVYKDYFKIENMPQMDNFVTIGLKILAQNIS